METSDLTIDLLRAIRDEIRTTNTRVETTNTRIGTTNACVEALRADTNQRLDRLDRRQTETEVRLSTELVAVAGAVREVRDLLREDRILQTRVEDHERRIAAIEARVG